MGSFYTAEEAEKAVKKFRETHPLPNRLVYSAAQRPALGGSSKYKGVSFNKFNKKDSKWVAKIRPCGKTKCLGNFPETKKGEKQAALAYDKAAEEQWGEHAKHNQYWFPEDFK